MKASGDNCVNIFYYKNAMIEIMAQISIAS